MDKDLRQSLRDADPLRRGVLLRRAGRVDEALDAFEGVWTSGDPAGAEHALELILSRPDDERILHASRLDRMALGGLEEAQTLLEALFPAAMNIVGESQAMRDLRSFVYREARSGRPLILWGESGVGHELTARTLHALSARDGFHEGYGARTHKLLRRELSALPPGGTLYMSYANDEQGWEEFVLETCASRDLRLVVGAVSQYPPRVLLRGCDDVGVQRIAPLRERFEDLPAILRALLERVGAQVAADAVTAEEVRKLTWHDWPGNVRELANHVKRAKVASHDDSEIMTQLFQGLFGLPGEVAQSLA